MDESAVLTLEREKDAYFHDMCVVGECLVQVLVLKEVPATGAFCSEKARAIVRKRCPVAASSFVPGPAHPRLVTHDHPQLQAQALAVPDECAAERRHEPLRDVSVVESVRRRLDRPTQTPM